ncbi:protein BIG GRAIN 1-like B [Silene latifolia]|uniref:protein BIG GRAIN 1-like B n=1 Tax=Silene latifolia TaxID=37657 RepID=UPI003D77A5C5
MENMNSSYSNLISPQQNKPSSNMSTFQTTATTTTTIPFHNNINHKRRAKTPSFSSILLDAIYRSIDDTYTDTDSTPKTATTTTTIYSNNNDDAIDYDYTHASKQRRSKMRSDSNTLETINLRHAIMIDSWIDKQSPPTPPQPRPQQQQQPKGYYQHQNANHNKIKFVRQNSVPYRSSNYVGSSSTSSSSSCFTHPKRETPSRIFNKTKLKALKIYSDLKKSKQQRQQQPVSPGARIVAFLNSIFRNAAVAQPRRSPENPPLTTMSTSTCSSASSFTRSCMSKTTISTEKSNRSVRFYPVNTFIIEDDDTKSLCRKDNLHNVDDRKLLVSSTKAAFDHQQHNKKLKKENEIESMITKINRNRSHSNNHDHNYKELLSFEMCSDEELMKLDDDNDDEDDESCASSDLFELENLSSIGVSTFSEELPVYGTTSLKKLIS